MSAHFDKIGMQHAGVQMRVPIRLRSEPLGADGSLAPIRALGMQLNVVVVLYRPDIEERRAPWLKLSQDAENAISPLLGIVVTMDAGLSAFDSFAKGQTVGWPDWQGLDEAAHASRLLIHVVNAIRPRLSNKPPGQREQIFLSQAKADGKLAAERILRHIGDPANACASTGP